jgi:N utilization substance protein B
MAATDRNVLRLGAYEILFTQTPAAVAINEALELAKRFGAAQSAPFVNGILDKFIEGHGKIVPDER